MNKKGLLIAAVAMTFASSAFAASSYTSAGCGLGTMLFKGKSGKAQLILAATTNGTFGNQTFGISSETLECTSSGVVMNDKQAEVYASVNFQRLSREAAQGGGEYLDGLAELMGRTTPEQKARFAKLAQARYERVFPANGDARTMLAELKTL
jgi:hypothetical protein